MSWGARHRAATKPMPLTSRNSSEKTMISVMWSLIAGLPGRRPAGRQVDDGRGGHAEEDERELHPVERRKAEEPRLVVVVQRDQQRHDDRNDEQPVPGAAVTARIRGLFGHGDT